MVFGVEGYRAFRLSPPVHFPAQCLETEHRVVDGEEVGEPFGDPVAGLSRAAAEFQQSLAVRRPDISRQPG